MKASVAELRNSIIYCIIAAFAKKQQYIMKVKIYEISKGKGIKLYKTLPMSLSTL